MKDDETGILHAYPKASIVGSMVDFSVDRIGYLARCLNELSFVERKDTR